MPSVLPASCAPMNRALGLALSFGALTFVPACGTSAELSRDEAAKPGALAGEAAALAMTGGRRVVRLREATDAHAGPLKDALATSAEALLVLEGGELTARSKLRVLAEAAPEVAVIACYRERGDELAATLGRMLKEQGVQADPAALSWLATRLGEDRMQTRREVEKLALYVGADPQAPRPATPEDHAAIGAATEEDGFAPLVNAVLGGETAKIGNEIRRMRELGLNPVGVALALERRAAQLAQIAAYLGPKKQFDDIDKGAEMRLGIFFREKRDIAVQYRRWTQPAARGARETRLDRLIPRLVALHRNLIANSQAAELLLAQELAEIGRFAAKR